MEKITANNLKDWIIQIENAIKEINSEYSNVYERIRYLDFVLHNQNKTDIEKDINDLQSQIEQNKFSTSAYIEELKQDLKKYQESIKILNSKEKYEYELSELNEKKESISMILESLRTDLHSCEKILHDIAKTTVLQSEEAMNTIIEGFINQSNDIIASLENKKIKQLKEKELLEQYISLSNVRQGNYHFISMLGTEQQKLDSYINFIEIIKQKKIYDKISYYIEKYENNDVAILLKNIKKIDLSDIDKVQKLIAAYKKEFDIVKDYVNMISTIDFNMHISQEFALRFFNNGDKNFDDKYYFPGFKYCTKKDIIDFINSFMSIEDPKIIDYLNEEHNINVMESKEFLSKFDVNNLTSEEICIIVNKLSSKGMFSRVNFGEKGTVKIAIKLSNEKMKNEWKSYHEQLEGVNSTLNKIELDIEKEKEKIGKYKTGDKKGIISNEIYGLVIDTSTKPINPKIYGDIDIVNSIRYEYLMSKKLLEEDKKIINNCESIENFEIYKEFYEDFQNRGNYNTDILEILRLLKDYEQKINDQNMIKENAKNDLDNAESEKEASENKVKNSKDEFEKYKESKNDILFTNKKGRVVKSKIGKFFFKMTKKYKQNTSSYDSQISILENLCKDNEAYDDRMKDVLMKAKSDFNLQNRKYDNLISEFDRYKKHVDIETCKIYEQFTNDLGTMTSYYQKIKEVESLEKKLCDDNKKYFEKLKEIRNIPNIPNDLITLIDNLLNSESVEAIEVVSDENGVKYFKSINEHYQGVIRDNLLSENIDANMDKDEATEVLQGRRK